MLQQAKPYNSIKIVKELMVKGHQSVHFIIDPSSCTQLAQYDIIKFALRYCRSLGEVNQKLLELYEWSLPHNLVVVDVCHDVCDSFVHKIAHCIACLYGFLHSMETQQRKRCSSKTSKESKIYCIFSIKFDEQNFTREQHT
ncbi:hypothetical protein GQX74_007422 [Glossina fuscipes]|nr:hypothetical protein GQX74_007422 [Glossina fuscipes]